MIEGFKTKFWAQRVEHVVIILTETFEEQSERGRVGEFLNQLASLQGSLASCCPELPVKSLHFACPILRASQLTPQQWADHLIVRQWLKQEEVVRYRGKVLQPNVASDELPDVGYDQSRPVDQVGPVCEDIFVTLPNSREHVHAKQGIYHLDSSTPRPSRVNGVFTDDRGFTMEGAKQYVKNLKIAISKVEEQNFAGLSSTPDSNQIAQFLASGSGDSTGAANSSLGNQMEHSGTGADP